jgi:hypothetical protein
MAEGVLSRLRPQQQALVLRAIAMQEAQRMAQSRGQRGALASLAQRFGFPVAPGAQDRLSRLPQDMVAGAPVVGDIASGVGRWAQENPLDAGALAVSPVPVLGDIAGLANDMRHYATDPESRTWGNYALSAAGLLPLVPGVAGVVAKSGKKMTNSLPVQPTKENLADLLDANFDYGRVVGNKTISIKNLFGGVGDGVDDRRRVDDLVKAMQSENGYIERLVVDSKGNVVEGQHRLDALRKMGIDKVPVTVVEDMAENYPVSAMMEAGRANGLRGDQAPQMLRQALEAIADSGSPAKALEEYTMPPSFSKAWEAVLKAAETSAPAKAADNLPMDEASRMARAREMGFDPGVALYRGQPEDYASLRPSERGRFGPGVYASEQPGVAEMYGDFVAPLVGPRDDALFNAMPGARSLDAGARDRIIAQLKPDEVAKLATFEKWYGQDAEAFWEALRRVAGDERASEAISAAGFKGIRGIGDGAETVVFDPRDVRSRFARFDPRNADSADLLAGVAGAGVVGNALLADRDRRSNSGGT